MNHPETVGTNLQVYMNIRKFKQGAPFWSLRDKKTKKVVGHECALVLEKCTFTVQPAGQAKVRRTNRKNVHAWIAGTRVDVSPVSIVAEYGLCPTLRSICHKVIYNPYQQDGFTLLCNQKLVTWAHTVIFHPNGGLYVLVPLSREWLEVNDG